MCSLHKFKPNRYYASFKITNSYILTVNVQNKNILTFSYVNSKKKALVKK